ncbi:MAG: hypothetical protein HXS50_02190 [Theionarchaea archaeon]|nr:hypothetical protein [Theionarchaea archaeon]
MGYETIWYQFTGHPECDSCWSLSTGPDGRIYAAACAEGIPGGVVKVVRYDEEKDEIEYLFDMDEMVDDPRDSGRATQCKIHYSFAPSMGDGIMYMASHLSGPPIDLPAYSPWGMWHNEERCFRGSALLAFDTKTDDVIWWDTLIPKEGCRCLALDEEYGKLYAVSYPRDHLIVYDIEKRKREDVGRIGSVNAQAIVTDLNHRVWTTDDYGHLVRYDPEDGRIRTSPFVLPHNQAYQTGWHSVFYDVARQPNTDCIYAVTWIANPWLMRIFLDEGEWGRVEDLGPATQERDHTIPISTGKDHCGGLVFAGDGQLYYVASRWKEDIDGDPKRWRDDPRDWQGVVWRMSPETLEREEVAILNRPDSPAQYVSRGAVDHNGDLFFGHVGKGPVGLFKVPMPEDRKRENAHLPIRTWG